MKVPPVLLLLLLLLPPGLGTPPGTAETPGAPSGWGVLYPFGPRAGDAPTPLEDDGTSPEIALEEPLPFLGSRYRACFVSNNGVVSLGSALPALSPRPFPLLAWPFLAPFWADADPRLNGLVWFRLSRRPELLRRLRRDLRPARTPGEPHPRPTWALVATWERVAFFGAASDKVNTFQAVLASDGVSSFVLFNYGDLQWTTGIADGGDPHTGLGGHTAQAGFNSGDDLHFYALPGSGSPAVLALGHHSNVGVPGRWAFRLDRPVGPTEPPRAPSVPPRTPSEAPRTRGRVYNCGL